MEKNKPKPPQTQIFWTPSGRKKVVWVVTLFSKQSAISSSITHGFALEMHIYSSYSIYWSQKELRVVWGFGVVLRKGNAYNSKINILPPSTHIVSSRMILHHKPQVQIKNLCIILLLYTSAQKLAWSHLFATEKSPSFPPNFNSTDNILEPTSNNNCWR